MADTTLPVYTDSVDQSWFIEPLNGPLDPRNFLDNFPDEVYTKSIDSHLVRFMYALLGPAGIGWLKKNLLDARLWFEDHGFDLFDLERYYGDPFRFGRILGELYDEDPTGLLPQDSWNRIKARDEGYRSRALDYFKGARLGNSPPGMTLIAQSGLGHRARIVENYKFFFDNHSDRPMGLPYYGSTNSTEEFIVIPRPEISRSEIHDVNFTGLPNMGTFQFQFGGHTTKALPYGTALSGSASVIVKDAVDNLTPIMVIYGPGDPYLIRLFGATPEIRLLVNQGGGVAVIVESFSAGSPTDVQGFVDSINTTSQYLSAQYLHAGRVPNLAYGGITGESFTNPGVKDALEALPNIGKGNVEVVPTFNPNTPYRIVFTGDLSNQDLPVLNVVDSLSGGSVAVQQVENNLDPADEPVTIAESSKHNLQVALDYIKPVTAITSLNDGSGTRIAQPWKSVTATTEFTEVARCVTGSSKISWPKVDKEHWIVAQKEIFAPRLRDDRRHHYVGFHNISDIKSYTDQALTDPAYLTDTSVLPLYKSEHIGPYGPAQNIIPLFAQLSHAGLISEIYTADRALADYAEPLLVTTLNNKSGTNFINGIYPVDYSHLAGVPQIKYKDAQFWSSRERLPGDTEYLEIDLGSTQAVNYLSLEIIRKPVRIDISLDVLDQAPRRQFVSVTPLHYTDWDNNLYFAPLVQNPWHQIEYHFVDSLKQTPFTRFIRIAITRRPDEGDNAFLYNPLTHVQAPWSIEVRNLRIGRNVVS